MRKIIDIKSALLTCVVSTTLVMGADPDIVTNLAFNGDPNNGAGNVPVVVKYNSTQNSTDYNDKTVLAYASDVGAVWGMAYAPQKQKLYAASLVRRHTGLKGDAESIYEFSLNSNHVSLLTTILNNNLILSSGNRELGTLKYEPLLNDVRKDGNQTDNKSDIDEIKLKLLYGDGAICTKDIQGNAGVIL